MSRCSTCGNELTSAGCTYCQSRPIMGHIHDLEAPPPLRLQPRPRPVAAPSNPWHREPANAGCVVEFITMSGIIHLGYRNLSGWMSCVTFSLIENEAVTAWRFYRPIQ